MQARGPNQLPPPDNRNLVMIAIACIAAGLLLLLGGFCGFLSVTLFWETVRQKSGSAGWGFGAVAFCGAVAVGAGWVAYLIVRRGILRK